MLRKLSLLAYIIKALSAVSFGFEFPESDPRSTWQCAYPYTETTCQSILLSWAKDHNTPWEIIFAGSECSGCEPHYETDESKSQHLTHAECKNRMGSRFTSQDLISPITRYRESTDQNPGWSISGWSFRPCFQTWQCSRYCSLTQYPPACIKYRSSNWGLYQPHVNARCEDRELEDPAPYGQPGSLPSERGDLNLSPSPLVPKNPINIQNEQRDKTWTPVY